MNLPRTDPRTDRRLAAARRVRDLLRSAIVDEEIGTGPLPSEAELMLAYSASRQVIRDALGMLRTEGLVTRTQGTGTSAVTSKVRHAFDHLHGPARRQVVAHRILTVTEETAPPRVAAKLRMPAGSTVGIVEYLTLFDDSPYYVCTAYVPTALLPVLARAERVTEWYSLYEDAGIELGVTDQAVEATIADPHHAQLLAVAPGDPLMLFERLIRDHTGVPLEYGFARVRGDRVVLRAQLPRRHARRPRDAEREN